MHTSTRQPGGPGAATRLRRVLHLRPVGILASILALGACATAPDGSAPTSRTGVTVQTDGRSEGMTLTHEANISTLTLPAPPTELWPVLVRVYGDAGLAVTGADSDRHLLVSSGGRVRRIAGDPVARFFTCPGTAYGNTATSGDVYPLVRTELIAADGGTEVRMQVEANAVTATGSRGRCRSTGRLERLLRDALSGG